MPADTLLLAPATRWRALTDLTLDRAPTPYALTALLLGAVVLVEQIMEQALLGPIDRFFTPSN